MGKLRKTENERSETRREAEATTVAGADLMGCVSSGAGRERRSREAEAANAAGADLKGFKATERFKIRLRSLYNRYPFLDRIRLTCLAWISDHGTTFFGQTYRITTFSHHAAKPYWHDPERPAIFAIYHGRMVGLLGLMPRRKLTILISNSRDGEIIARACQGLGFSIARGSPATGAVRGVLEMVNASYEAQRLAFTVDGPRGPIYCVKEGIIRLAEITGLPIIPFVCHARTCYWMKSWDRFMAPWWGTPIVYLFGEPIHVISKHNSDTERKQLCELLNSRMSHLKELGESFF